MSRPIELFSYWTRYYSVTLVPPNRQEGTPALLRFQRKLGRSEWQVRDLFKTWFTRPVTTRNVKTALEPIHLNAILSISPIDERGQYRHIAEDEILRVAEQLGPILTVLPYQSPNVLYEPVDAWRRASEALIRLIYAIQDVQEASRDSSKTARKRRGYQLAKATIPGFDFLPNHYQKLFAMSNRPAPGISARVDAERELAKQIDFLWFLPLKVNEEHIEDIRLIEHLRLPRLRFSADGEGRSMQINVPFGIQALLIMLVYDQTIGHTLFPRNCARPGCQKLVLMGPRRLYCSDKCQRSAAAKRYRDTDKQARSKRQNAKGNRWQRKVTHSTGNKE